MKDYYFQTEAKKEDKKEDKLEDTIVEDVLEDKVKEETMRMEDHEDDQIYEDILTQTEAKKRLTEDMKRLMEDKKRLMEAKQRLSEVNGGEATEDEEDKSGCSTPTFVADHSKPQVLSYVLVVFSFSIFIALKLFIFISYFPT
jgi:hypothetical protein